MRIENVSIDGQYGAGSIEGTAIKKIAITHKGKVIHWESTYFSGSKLKVQPFSEINGFLETLPESAHDDLFDCYQQINSRIDIASPDILHKEITKIVSKMYRYFDIEAVHRWLITNTRFYIPAGIKDTFEGEFTEEESEAETRRFTQGESIESSDQQSNKTSPELTYLRNDYIDLTVLSVWLQPMAPIWLIYGQYLKNSSSGFQELTMLELLEGTPFEDFKAYDKLLSYCKAYADSKLTGASSIEKNLMGLGSTEVPIWIMSRVVVRRLTTAPILTRMDKESHTLISVVFHYVRQLCGPKNGSGEKRIAAKKLETSNNGDEDKNSFIEHFKIKQEAIGGDVVLNKVYVEDAVAVALRVDPTVPVEFVEECMRAAERMASAQIYPHQLSLMQWAMGLVIPPKVVMQLKPVSRAPIQAVSQALLWHWGYADLAVFISVERFYQQDADGPLFEGTVIPRSRIKKEHQERLMELFPHEKATQFNVITTPKRGTFINPATDEINWMAESMRDFTWRYIGSQRLLNESNQYKGSQTLALPIDIKVKLAELAIMIGEKLQ